jgi:hypothetical protein
VVIGLLAAFQAFAASLARIDSGGELDELVTLDVIIGGMSAVALLLVAAPALPGVSVRWRAAVVVAAGVLWAVASGALIWHHEEQVRIRSTRPA